MCRDSRPVRPGNVVYSLIPYYTLLGERTARASIQVDKSNGNEQRTHGSDCRHSFTPKPERLASYRLTAWHSTPYKRARFALQNVPFYVMKGYLLACKRCPLAKPWRAKYHGRCGIKQCRKIWNVRKNGISLHTKTLTPHDEVFIHIVCLHGYGVVNDAMLPHG